MLTPEPDPRALRVVLVCGSRGWSDEDRIRDELARLHDAVLVCGGADGADAIATRVAGDVGLHVAVVKPLWIRYGKAAGARRNAAMFTLAPELVLAFWDGSSPGTKMTIKLAWARGVPVRVFTPDADADERLRALAAEPRR